MAISTFEREKAKPLGTSKVGTLAAYKLVAEGLEKKLKGEELLDYVYNGLSGSPILEGGEAVEAEKKEKDARARVKKRETGGAAKRSKITVK